VNKGSGILLTKSVTQSFQHGAQNHFVFTMAEWLYAWGIKMIKRNLNKENTTNLYEVNVTNKFVPRFWWIWLNSRFALFETFLTHAPRCGNIGFQECHLSQMVTVLDNILMMSKTCEIRLSQALTFNLYQWNYLFKGCVILII